MCRYGILSQHEAPIKAVKAGWAEQDPQMWWDNAKLSLKKIMADAGATREQIKGIIGISYRMHPLVCVDKDQKVLRDAIIWCDSRAVPYGEKAMTALTPGLCLGSLLNSPGNFTAAKLAWVKENRPQIFNKIYKVMLPGDYIAMKLSGTISTTISGLSEGMFWDFKERRWLSSCWITSVSEDVIADIVPTFSVQSTVSKAAAEELGLKAGTPISYRGGDQPNKRIVTQCVQSGQIASTARTSGVVYGVLGDVNYDPKSREHVCPRELCQRAGPSGRAACINGTGIPECVDRNVWLPKASRIAR